MFKKMAVAAAVLLAGVAQASEFGQSVYPHGNENFMSGALPPPGVYGMVFGESYSADRLNDKDGNDLKVPGFKVRANAVAPRIVWVPGTKVLGGDLVVHTIVPLVDLEVSTPAGTTSKSGLADIVVGVGVGHHHSANLHSVAAIDVVLPTGRYDKNDGPANIGKNHSAIEPVYALSYIDPNGFNGDVKLGYIINQRNGDTDYKSGDEFHFDYAAGWGMGNGWTVGVGGYYRQQVTDDKRGGVTVDYAKSAGRAIGPNVKYDSGKGWFVTAKWQKESGVKNGAQGDAFKIKAVFPF
jgi:hypothetical protein